MHQALTPVSTQQGKSKQAQISMCSFALNLVSSSRRNADFKQVARVVKIDWNLLEGSAFIFLQNTMCI